jgi:hypothetical protein
MKLAVKLAKLAVKLAVGQSGETFHLHPLCSKNTKADSASGT